MVGIPAGLLRRIPFRSLLDRERGLAEEVNFIELDPDEQQAAIAHFKALHPDRETASLTELISTLPDDLRAQVKARRPQITQRRKGRGGRPSLAPEHYATVAEVYRRP